MNAVMWANVAVVILNVLLLSVLLVLYGKMLREMPTRFTLGLFGFAAVLWIQSAAQLYFFATMMDYVTPSLEPLMLAQNALASVASALLLSVTWAPSSTPERGPTDA